MKACRRLFWSLVLFGVTAKTAIAQEGSIELAPPAQEEILDSDTLVSELSALRSRIEELERHQQAAQPTLDLHAFQNECNSSVFCSTQDGKFCANLGGRIEQDWLWASGNDNLNNAIGPIKDAVFFRRARLHTAGTLYSLIDYYAEFEFAPVDNIVFQDVWMQLRDVPFLGHIRAGHLKVPFGLENETSAKHLTFLERSAVHDAFQQEYDPGIMIWNTFLEDDLRFAAALLRFDPRESGQSFGDGEYSLASRLTGAIWHNEDDTTLVHVGASFRHNKAAFDATNGFSGFQFRARPEIRNTPRFIDTGFFAADHTNFVGVEAALVLGRFSAQAELVQSHTDDAVSGLAARDLTAEGFYVATSYFLTGEHRPYSRSNAGFGRIVPHKNVSPKDGFGMLRSGALEAKARYSEVDLSEFGEGKLQTWTFGLNWYLIPNSKILLDYIIADRKVAPLNGKAELLGLRFNVEF